MILSWLVSLGAAIYPWNVDLSSYLTLGEYTNSISLRTYSHFIAIDRRMRDLVIFGFEAVHEEDGGYLYDQQNFIFRGAYQINPYFRGGLFAIYLQKYQGRETIVTGPVLESEYGQCQFKFWLLTMTQMGNDAYQFQIPATTFQQYAGSLGWQIGPYHLRGTIEHQLLNSSFHTLFIGTVEGTIGDHLGFQLEHGFGENRIRCDPLWLIVDSSQDLSTVHNLVKIRYRFSPHFYLIGSYTRKDFEPFPDDGQRWGYTARYYTLGAKLRF